MIIILMLEPLEYTIYIKTKANKEERHFRSLEKNKIMQELWVYQPLLRGYNIVGTFKVRLLKIQRLA